MPGIHPPPAHGASREDLHEYSQWYACLPSEEQEKEKKKRFPHMPDPDKQHIIDVPKLHPDIQAAIDPETKRLVERYRTKPRKKKNARDDRESS